MVPGTDGLQLTTDGQTGHSAGFDLYWIGFLINDVDVGLVMNHLHEPDLDILRV